MSDARHMIQIAAKAIGDKKGFDVEVIDVAGISSVTNYVIIASGLNAPHLKALVDETLSRLKKKGFQYYQKSGEPDSGWVVADYVDVMIHLFSREQREYYGMDTLFEKAPKIRV